MIDVIRIEYQFFATVIADILRALDGKSNGGAFTLSFCCIDYMGFALNTNKAKNSKQDFKAYLDTYLAKLNSNYSIYSDHLYAIRCSLVHTYGYSEASKKLDFIPNLIFTDPRGDFHFYYEKKSKKLFISMQCFIADLIASVYDFFKLNFNEQEQLNRWFSNLFYHYNEVIAVQTKKVAERGHIIYKEIHERLAVLDDENEPLRISEKMKFMLD